MERASGVPVVKTCPWCGGPLLFTPRYPVSQIIPGEPVRLINDDNIPEDLRTVPAWVCQTAHCRYREPA